MSIISLPHELPVQLHHGGRLHAAAARYAIAPEQWLDLSTGINPDSWPIPAIPTECWARLPQDDDGLEQAAQAYYGAEHVLAVAGSQAAIQTLPRLRPPSRVSVLAPGYAEHAQAWQGAGHTVTSVTLQNLDDAVADTDVLVLINPNNPTGASFPLERLLGWHAQLAARGGWLVVDEAFMDVTPELSLCGYSAHPGLIVLRSLGKFFGLAGARVGFVCAQAALLGQLHTLLGPWTVNTPARWLASRALQDRAWQASMRRTLAAAGLRLQTLLTQHGLTPDGGCALFQWLRTPHASELHETLARQGILTRLFDTPSSLRFGLPGQPEDWTRLEAALRKLAPGNKHTSEHGSLLQAAQDPEGCRGHGPLLRNHTPLVGAGHAHDNPQSQTHPVGAGHARDRPSTPGKPGHAALRKGRVSLPNHIYIITTVTRSRQPFFAQFDAAAEACRCLQDPGLLEDATVLAWVVMPDHSHWLLQLGEQTDLSRIVNRLKSASARRVNRVLDRSGPLWEPAFHDRALRKDEDMLAVARYIIANPVRAGIVQHVGDYPFWDTVWL